MNGEELPGHQVNGAADPLAGAMETLAGLTAAAAWTLRRPSR